MNTVTHAIPTLSLQWKQRSLWSFGVFGYIVSKQNSGGNLCPCIISVFRKKTYTGLLTNYFSFTPFQYKLGLIKTLIDGAYKINNIT